MKRKNRSNRAKTWKRKIFKKTFYFQLHIAHNEIQTPELIREFACWPEPAFPTCMDIPKYVIAQATEGCAGFLVRVWWRYLRVLFLDTVKCRLMFLRRAKRKEIHSINFFILFYLDFLHSVLFSFTLPLIDALQLVRISRFFDMPQQASSVTCIDTLWVWSICRLRHTDAMIVVVIVLVTMIIVIIVVQ
jgi:hypothetical protein